MSDAATTTLTDATRTGPPPPNVPEPQPCDVETQAPDGYVNNSEDQLLQNTAAASTPSNTVHPASVLRDEQDHDAGLTPVVPPIGPNATTTDAVVSVPLGQFRRLVELLGEVVQEIKSTRQIPPDLEQGNTTSTRRREMSNKCYSYCNFLHDRYPKEEAMEYRKKAVDKIWNSVEPWDMARLSEISEEPVSHPDPDDIHFQEGTGLMQLVWSASDTVHKHWRHERNVLLAEKLSRWWDFIGGHEETDEETDRLDMYHLLSRCVDSVLSRDKCRLGDILLDCYKSRTLYRPTSSEIEDKDIDNIVAIIGALLINDERFGSDIVDKYWPLRHLSEFKPRNMVLGMDVASLFQAIHLVYLKPLELEGSKDSAFAASDLNIKALKSIGGLSIEWTDTFDDHLRLNIGNKTLHIAWFLVGEGPHTKRYFDVPRTDARVTCTENPSPLNLELISSWAILFATSRHLKDRERAYDQLGKPNWHSSKEIRDYYKADPDAYEELRTWHVSGRYDPENSHCYRRIQQAAFYKTPINFAEFPILESRLRQLRQYMDIQKPRGLRQLWRDNRDSLNYYTFWLVVTFGMLSIILAMGSLAVSAAQTWASFRALEMASSPTALSS